MFIAVLAVATVAAANPAPGTKFVFKVEPTLANCRMMVQDASTGVEQSSPQVWRPGKDGPGLTREWKPRAYPEAGYYHTLNKTLNGCMVPVPMSLTNATASKPKP